MGDDNYDPAVEREERIIAAIEQLKGWPLDKRETFAALNMMGLASRLQPLHLESANHQALVVGLSFKLADLAIAECEKK